MNEQSDFERYVADQLGSAAVGAPPEAAITETIERAGGSRRLPEWLALIKETPMRTNSHLAVGSPTVRVVLVMTATLLLAVALAGAGAGVQRLLAAGPIVVAADGSGDYATIQAGIDAAEDGDEIHVMPGTYLERVIIDGTDLVLMGIGMRADVIIEPPPDQPPASFIGSAFGLALLDSEAHVSGLTLRGRDASVYVSGGAPTLDDLVLDGAGDVPSGAGSAERDSIGFYAGSQAAFSGSEVIAGGSIGIHTLAEPRIERNLLRGGPNIYIDQPGPGTLIEGNTIVDAAGKAIGVFGSGPLTITGNTIENAGDEAIGVNARSAASVTDNTIANSGNGVVISAAEDVELSRNRITDSGVGIWWSGQGVIDSNEIGGGTDGIVVSGGTPAVRGNTVQGAENRGVAIVATGSPTLSGNTSCGNGENLWIDDDAEQPEIDDSNEFCEQEPSE